MSESKSLALFADTLPADSTAVTGSLRALAAARTQVGGKPYMKMGKEDGVFRWGVDQIVVDDDELWAVNPSTFMLGVIGWRNGQVVGESMFPITSGQRVDYDALEPIAERPGTGDGWKEQLTVEMRSMKDGTEVIFKTSALGGKNALSKLAEAIATQMEENPARPVPVCQLSHETYKHKQYGNTRNPIFTPMDWVDMQGKKPRKKAVAAKPEPDQERPALV